MGAALIGIPIRFYDTVYVEVVVLHPPTCFFSQMDMVKLRVWMSVGGVVVGGGGIRCAIMFDCTSLLSMLALHYVREEGMGWYFQLAMAMACLGLLCLWGGVWWCEV